MRKRRVGPGVLTGRRLNFSTRPWRSLCCCPGPSRCCTRAIWTSQRAARRRTGPPAGPCPPLLAGTPSMPVGPTCGTRPPTRTAALRGPARPCPHPRPHLQFPLKSTTPRAHRPWWLETPCRATTRCGGPATKAIWQPQASRGQGLMGMGRCSWLPASEGPHGPWAGGPGQGGNPGKGSGGRGRLKEVVAGGPPSRRSLSKSL